MTFGRRELMTLDVLVPTYGRPDSLTRTLLSLCSARPAPMLEVRLVVVQNDTQAATRAAVTLVQQAHPGRVQLVAEPRGGKSRALNTALTATTGDLVAVVDDDEEVDPGWFEAVAATFGNPAVDFIGGPCLPRWGASPPAWLPRRWDGVLGNADDGDRVKVYGCDASGILMGGNAVIRRAVLDRVGPFALHLGPTPDERLLSGEDEEFFLRLLAAGAHGLYVPTLRVYHHVPASRLSRRYYRRWSFWNGIARSLIDRVRPLAVARVGRVPRYLVGEALRGLGKQALGRGGDPATRFAYELSIWQLAGFLYGSYLYRPRRLPEIR